jgi:hypothetical protein
VAAAVPLQDLQTGRGGKNWERSKKKFTAGIRERKN